MIDIQVDDETIKKISTILMGMEGMEKTILKPAITRSVIAGRKEAVIESKKTYRIKSGDFKANSFIQMKRAQITQEGVVGSVSFSGRTIPLMKFKVSTSGKKKIPSAAVLKSNSLVKFSRENNVFVAKMKSGHIGIFERQNSSYYRRSGSVGRTKHNQKIKQLMSPSVPTMVGKDSVIELVSKRVQEMMQNRIEHGVDRYLKGDL